VRLVFARLAGGGQVPHPGSALIGRAQAPPRRAAGFFAFAADGRPLPAGPGLQVQRPEFIQAEDHLRVTGRWGHLAAGDGVQVFDAGLLRLVARVFGGLPGR